MAQSSQDLDAARTFYTRISAVYDQPTDRDERRARELGLSLLDPRPAERILEIGFGTGSSIIPIATAVGASGQVFGVDISPGMRSVAEERVRSASPAATINLSLGAVPPIPFSDGTFDAAFMAFTLELFPDDTIPVLLREVRRTLRAGGRLAVVSLVVGTEGQRAGLPERIYRSMPRLFPHIVDCRPIDAEGELVQAGFTIVRVEQLEIWGLPVAAIRAQ